MEGSVYSNLGLKKNRTFQDKRDNQLFTLKDVQERKVIINSTAELKQIFINDLKAVLQKDNVFSLIENFFQLEHDLHSAQEQFDFEASPLNFEEFYKNLSPVLMRALLENVTQANNAENLLKAIKESIRIALEEELHQIDDQY
jgi:hypothetical protein